ncbi:MAG: hypothetical protein Q4A92_06305, partial [Corynebacterium sp.]|nr:hypothetical protein [Corynebacterium sp.]
MSAKVAARMKVIQGGSVEESYDAGRAAYFVMFCCAGRCIGWLSLVWRVLGMGVGPWNLGFLGAGSWLWWGFGWLVWGCAVLVALLVDSGVVLVEGAAEAPHPVS